jgi:1-deoxyxylulose-5-phosphate synthase
VKSSTTAGGSPPPAPRTALTGEAGEGERRKIADALGAIATARGVTRALVALAWLLLRPVVASPIVGATKPPHPDDAVAAVHLSLSEQEMRQLEETMSRIGVEGF